MWVGQSGSRVHTYGGLYLPVDNGIVWSTVNRRSIPFTELAESYSVLGTYYNGGEAIFSRTNWLSAPE
jgi:hypothetical protein